MTLLRALLIAPLLTLLGGCSDGPPEPELLDDPARGYVELGDLPALTERGRLRILTPYTGETHLPREGLPLQAERELAIGLAHELGLRPVLVSVRDFGALIPNLLEGRGDLIAANLTVTERRSERVAFTVPVGQAIEQVVARAGDEEGIRRLRDLAGRTVAVPPGTTFWDTAQALRAQVPELRILSTGQFIDMPETLERVATGAFDLTIADSNVLDVVLDYRDDIAPVLDVSARRPLAWAVRPDNPELLAAVNTYLNREQLARGQGERSTADLPAIKERGVLRLVTRNTPATYFLWRGELMGFEYELAQRFARRLGVVLEVVVAPTHEDMLRMLVDGKADLAAAFLTPTAEREAMGIAFSRHYHYATEWVVGRAREEAFDDLDDLRGRRIGVRASSSYWQTLQALDPQAVGFELVALDETLDAEQIVAQVAANKIDLTVLDSHLLDMELTWRDDVRGLLELGEREAQGWAVRADNPKLLDAVNAFLRSSYRGEFYNITYRKYFKNPHNIERHREERVSVEGGVLSPYDALVREYAEQFGFDWRLIVAQMYQESRFDPDAESWAGAQGLMQVMPRTAREMGFEELTDPETGIHAGVKYMDWVRDRFEPELPVRDRTWFTLAAYNAGAGSVRDARRLARQKGWDPDRWFGNVERAMLLLSQRKYAAQARHGYVRGREPVNYVRNIRDRYEAYTALVGVDAS
jgi:membrane-bound lytic murein transglycosylase F